VNEIEQEAVILNAAWEMIDEMVNWAMFVKHKEPLQAVMFVTIQHARLFNILLGDFLSELKAHRGNPPPFGLRPAPSEARISDLTFLYYLRQVCADPRLGHDTGPLRDAVEAFANWLEHEFIAEAVNLGSISIVADISVKRWRYIKMCGDIGKHNIARLEANARHLRTLLAAAGEEISEQDSYLAIPDFYEWFHTNIFFAHATAIADFLNNIRIGIHHYLRAEFTRAYARTDEPFDGMYHYVVPTTITQPVAHAMYWDALNRVRSGLFMQRFAISDYFKEVH
jgi:hypothetical protein